MSYIFTICILIIFILCYMLIETRLLETNTFSFNKNNKGLKIVHLSDIHINMLFISYKKLLSVLKKIGPDIVVISGDYIEKEKNIPEFLEYLKNISAQYPVYLSLGNHDHKALKNNKALINNFINNIEKTGAIVLNNSNSSFIKNNKKYNLIGIDDLKQGTPEIDKAFNGIVPSVKSGNINIVFSHNPDIVLNLPKEKTDYFLCGHFHGGQIWMPFGLEFKLMRNEELCKRGYKRGLHKINGVNVYINRGLGNVVFPFRFLSRPEIAVLDLP